VRRAAMKRKNNVIYPRIVVVKWKKNAMYPRIAETFSLEKRALLTFSFPISQFSFLIKINVQK
jgi:hypothetical protein